MKILISILFSLLIVSCSIMPLEPTQQTGFLEGNVTIGPLTPVERPGVPPPTPLPEVFTSRGLNIFAADGTTLIATLHYLKDGTYRIALAPGSYVLDMIALGMDRSQQLPATITIVSGETVTLNIEIDTGIR
jgi:hypothetical protein